MARVRMKDGLGEITLKYLIEDMDRHGNVRLYVRTRKGSPKVRLRETPGTEEFLDEYRAAVKGKPTLPSERKELKLPDIGTLHWLCTAYYGSAEYKQLSDRTRKVRKGILEKFCSKHGEKPFAKLEPRHIRKMRDEKTDTPESANGLIKALRQLYTFAIEYELHNANPAKDVPYLRSGSDGHHGWTIEEVAQYQRRHPVGSKARLALALMLYTGQRRSDIVQLGPQHVKDGWLTLTQTKNKNRKPVTLSIPVLSELQEVIDQTKIGNLSFIVTEFGKPFTSNGFGNWFRKRCDEAGLQHCSAHGLRKAGAAIAAENGATEKQLMAIFGWTTMKEAARYTKAANQKKLAASGIKLLVSEAE